MGPAFSLEIENLKTHEVRSISVNAGWTEQSSAMYLRWCDCGAAGYFNRGQVDMEGKFIDSTLEHHSIGAQSFVRDHGCDHSKLTRFKFIRARLQDGRTVEITPAGRS